MYSLFCTHYKLKQKIDEKENYTLFNGIDILNDQKVFIKIFPPHSPISIDTLLQLPFLNHPNILPILDAGYLSENRFFIIFPYINGTPISSCFDRARNNFISIAFQLANSLAFLHYSGIIHRDISLNNLILTPGGKLILSDLDFCYSPSLTISRRELVGTLPYIKPDILKGKEYYSYNSDLYAAGIVLLELYTGKKLKEDVSYTALMKKISSIRDFNTRTIIKKLIGVEEEFYNIGEDFLCNLLSLFVKNKKLLDQVPLEYLGGINLWEETKEERILKGLLAQVEDSQSRIALIIGENKIGKTTLIKNFIIRNKSSSGRFIFIEGCNFFSFLKAFEKQLAFLIHREKYFPLKEILNWEEKRILDYFALLQSQKFKLFDKILNYTEEIIKKNKLKFLIFIIDDLHLCDSLVKDCLQYLVKNAVKLPILFLFSSTRAEEIFDFKTTAYIYLKPCSLENFKKFVYFPSLNKEKFFQFLFKKSSGIPFYFSEIMREFLINKYTNLELLFSKINEQDFFFIKSPLLQDLYQKKISKLTPVEKEILELSSLFRGAFDLEDISFLRDYPNIEKFILRLIDDGFIREFGHKKYIVIQPWRDLIFDLIPQSKKERLNLLLTNHFIKKGKSYSDIAYYFFHSCEKKKGIPYALKGAEEERKKLNYEQGLKILNQYFSIINSIENNNIKFDYFSLRGKLNLLLNNFSSSRRDLEKALNFSKGKKEEGIIRFQLAESFYGEQKYKKALEILIKNKEFLNKNFKKETKLQILNDYLLVKNLWLTGKVREAINNLEKTVEKAYEIDSTLGARGAIELGYFLLMRRKVNKAEEYLKKGYELFRKYKKLPEHGLSMLYLAYLEGEKGNFEKSLLLLKDAYHSFIKIHDFFSQAKVASDLGFHYLHVENWEEAKKWFKISENLFDKINNPRGKTLAKFNLGEVALNEGEWDFAEKVFKESLDFDQASGNKWSVAYDLNSLGYIHFLRGNFEIAEKELKESKNIFKSLEASKEETDCLLKLSELYIEKKEYSLAQKCLINASEIIKKENFQKLNVQFLFLESIINMYRKNNSKAEEILEKCLKSAERIGIKSLIGKSLILKGKLIRDKDQQMSIKCFDKAIRIFKTLKNPYWLAEAFTDYYSTFPDFLKKTSGKNNIVWATETFKKLKSFKFKKGEDIIAKYLPQEIIIRQVKEEASTWITHSFSRIEKAESPSDVLEQLLNLILKEVPSERAITFLIDNEGNIVYQKSNEGVVDDKDICISLIKKCVKEKKVLIMNNLKTNPQYKDNESVIIYNIDSVICLPLTIEGKTVGVIYLDRKTGFEPFSSKDLEFLIAISKPISLMLRNSLEYKRLKDKLEGKYKYPLITASPKMEKIFSIIERVKNLDIPIMILGESGTGKELVARLIHSEGLRKNGEFVAVNCSALPENLLEAELFGYTKGAFTGANRDKKGLIEEANGGTFFLDEIGDLSLFLQAKLLRVLQEKEIRRLGENKTRPVNVRFISATNKNLDEEVKKGNFREDLYYRLKVVPIEIPPLRERREDIPLLADHFIKKYGIQMGREGVCFSQEAMEILLNYDWPGNVREMENEIQRILIFLGDENLIKKEHISSKILKATEGEVFQDFSKNLTKAKQEFEKKFILQALARNKYKKSKTAEELGLTRQGLLRLMKKHNII